MAGKKRAGLPKDRPSGSDSPDLRNGAGYGNGSGARAGESAESCPPPGLRTHALTLIIFFFSLFFILAISNPALFMNDEWITANQLHQLDLGHQVTMSEGKYGVTQNGTVSAYFTSRQNVLMYSLALPVSALPAVKLFGLFGDNFRLVVIMLWSVCLVLMALLIDVFYPGYSRIRGIRLLFPVLLLSLLLFMVNVLLYKQFPFSPPDAPFEAAALVLTNQVFFAILVSVVYETLHLILKNIRMALFGTLACISCSSYIFWAAAAKDHMLSTLVFSLVIYLFVLYLSNGKKRNAALAFVFSGLLVWIRPEFGFFVTIIVGLFFIIPLITAARSAQWTVQQLLISVVPAAGVFIGLIPFFLNNIMISHNWLIPAFDLPRDLAQTGSDIAVPLPLSQVVTDPSVITQTADLTFFGTLSRALEMVSHAMFGGITYDNMVRGFFGILTLPENQSIGFLTMCPIILIGLGALILWWHTISAALKSQKKIVFFIFLMICAVFFSYLTKFSSMNTSMGLIPDMRYLSPAYLPCGLFSMIILSKTHFMKKSGELAQSLLKYSFWGTVLLLPIIFFIMYFVQPFPTYYPKYNANFFELAVLLTLLPCLGVMFLSRAYSDTDGFFTRVFPLLLVLVIITVLSFQILLTSVYAMIVKINGYPFWIPLVREGMRMFIEVRYLPPV